MTFTNCGHILLYNFENCGHDPSVDKKNWTKITRTYLNK